jgi:L-seryl-tRNA(Ser) seleniumtransferase
MTTDAFRSLPSVDELAQHHILRGYERKVGRAIVIDAIRAQLDAARADIRAGRPAPMPALLLDAITERIERAIRPTLTRVINATGVILHTNLGRAPLSQDALRAIQDAAASYSNLEYDLDAGERGSRYVHAEALIKKLTGAEGALVVNNNAAAVMFVLRAFAERREVVVSRGQLVEIGGGFRVPDVLAQSGALMIEVGTTNRTRVADFENAITPQTALLLQVHPSNFRVIGFTEEVAPDEMAALAHKHQLLAVDDLGSGALLDTAAYGLAHEPLPQERLRGGADLVTFSGDKLLGGPQAGIIVGKAEYIARLKNHPLARALRVDKLTLAALQATLLHYLKNEATQKIPVWQMISATPDALETKAGAWCAQWQDAVPDARVIDTQSTVGGGSLPGEILPTRAVALRVASPDALVRALRENNPPIVARIENDAVVIDPRTILPHDEIPLLEGVARAVRLV